jgi:cytochrome c-type biogenesis protein CcmH
VISRRRWLESVVFAGSGALIARGSAAQQSPGKVADTSNLFAMDQSAARTVRLAPKPGALPSMTADDRDALEHHLRCQCGCTMDVYTCRTTDFSCQVSPAMHRDIMALVEGGYGAQEILDAFVNVYGDRVLMSPPKVGFNILGYVVPGIALTIGAVVLAIVIRRWNRATPRLAAAPRVSGLDATPDELKRLDAAIRDDS